MAGILFVVATPIGNLEDITLRALRVLREVDLIAAEDTRRTAKLLAHYEIHRPMTSVREHNEARTAVELLARMDAGDSIALVTDAGTPGISDPGSRLVAAARAKGMTVIPIPGPSAVAAAVSVAGFPADEFVFMGFPPPAGAARKDWIQRAAYEQRAVVFFEAPHRVRRTLSELNELVERQIFVGRELTKIHEESIIQPIETVSVVAEQRGEYVLVLAPWTMTAQIQPDAALLTRLVSALEGAGIESSEAYQFVARAVDLDTRAVVKAVKKYKISVKQQKATEP